MDDLLAAAEMKLPRAPASLPSAAVDAARDVSSFALIPWVKAEPVIEVAKRSKAPPAADLLDWYLQSYTAHA